MKQDHSFAILSVLALLAPPAAAQGPTHYVLPGDEAPVLCAGAQEKPAVARGNGGYLAVWEDTRTALGGATAPTNGLFSNRDVYGILLDDAGQPSQAVSFAINRDVFDQVTPRAAWNGENYLVVWRSSRATQFFVTTGIYATRVSPQGAVLDDPPILIDDSDDFDERDPAVASDGTNWLVVYDDYHGGASETLDGALVHPDGFVMQKQTILPGGQFQQPVNFDLEFAVDRYLVVYEKGFQGAYGRLLASDMSLLGAELTFQANTNKPEVASSGAGFFVSFSGARGTPVALDGTVLQPGGVSLSGGFSAAIPETDCAWDGLHWTVAFTDSSSLFLGRADASGLPFGTPVTVAANAFAVREYALANAAGATQVCWNDWSASNGVTVDIGDVWSAQVSDAGAVGPKRAASLAAPLHVQPAIAGSAQAGWLVAFFSRVSGTLTVMAQRLDATGQPIDLAPVALHTSPKARMLDVAFDGSEWLVVWDDDFGTLRHTFGRRVALDGTLLDAAPLNLLRGERPKVDAAEGQRLFLLASWDHNQSNEFIRAARIDGASGASLDAPYLTISSGSGFPDVLGFDDRWLVVWGGMTGAFIDVAGSVQTPFFIASAASETVHGLARDGDLALVAFRRHDSTSANGSIFGTRLMKDGTLLDSSAGFTICQAANLQLDPRAAFDGSSFRVTWTDYRAFPALVPGLGDLYMAEVRPDASVPTLCGTPLIDDLNTPEGDAELVAAAGQTVVAACVLHDEAPYAGPRIEIRLSASPDVGASYCSGDGSGTPCPCGNAGGAGSGCAHSGGHGAALSAFGSASVATDSLVFHGTDLPPVKVCILIQGNTQATGGAGNVFGDGLLCVGGGVKRLGSKVSDATGSALWGPGLANAGLWSAGTSKNFQIWLRDPTGPCGSGFTLSQALQVTFTP